MTFTRTGPNSASSDDGFEVTIANRYEINYVVAGEAVTIPIEIMTDRTVVVSVSHLPGIERELTKARIAAALQYLHIPHRFD